MDKDIFQNWFHKKVCSRSLVFPERQNVSSSSTAVRQCTNLINVESPIP
jgi:hypothetical protein